MVGQTSRRPQRMTSAPPIISLVDRLSPAKIAAVMAPKITSVISRMPTLAGSKRRVAHISAAMDAPHHSPPVSRTCAERRGRSESAIVGSGSRKGAKAKEVIVAPMAKRKAAGRGGTSDFRRIPAVASAQMRPPRR